MLENITAVILDFLPLANVFLLMIAIAALIQEYRDDNKYGVVVYAILAITLFCLIFWARPSVDVIEHGLWDF